MLKIEWKTVFKVWAKALIKEIIPLFSSAAIELFKELTECYNKDNLEELKALKAEGERLKEEQAKKFAGQNFNL